MKTSSVVVFVALAVCGCACGEEKETPTPVPVRAPVAYYNFAELIFRAERIVLGEIGEKKDGVVMIKALETLKGPARDPKKISPDAFKRAQELLNGGKSDVAPLPKDPAVAENVNVAVIPPSENMLPAQGTQVVFFLWEPEKREEGKPPTYRISHRQNVYDAKVVPQVRVALAMPRSVADGRYLRESDQKVAARAAQRKADEELKKMPAGEPSLGLQLEMLRPRLMLRGDNSVQLTVHLNNALSKEMWIYDGQTRSYGLIVRVKDAAPETAQVLHLTQYDDVDPTSLDITMITDFDSIPGNGTLSRELLFEAAKLPALKSITGDCLIRVFYTNKKNGVKDGLNSPAWMGTVISKEMPLTFKKVEEKLGKADR